MPLVRASAKTIPGLHLNSLGVALQEIVPAAFNSLEGRLTPGSIEFFGNFVPSNGVRMSTDVFIDIEAMRFDDRQANLDERTELVKSAMNNLFPRLTFAVWPKLVIAGWASDIPDPEFFGNMSMDAAMQRASEALGL